MCLYVKCLHFTKLWGLQQREGRAKTESAFFCGKTKIEMVKLSREGGRNKWNGQNYFSRISIEYCIITSAPSLAIHCAHFSMPQLCLILDQECGAAVVTAWELNSKWQCFKIPLKSHSYWTLCPLVCSTRKSSSTFQKVLTPVGDAPFLLFGLWVLLWPAPVLSPSRQLPIPLMTGLSLYTLTHSPSGRCTLFNKSFCHVCIGCMTMLWSLITAGARTQNKNFSFFMLCTQQVDGMVDGSATWHTSVPFNKHMWVPFFLLKAHALKMGTKSAAWQHRLPAEKVPYRMYQKAYHFPGQTALMLFFLSLSLSHLKIYFILWERKREGGTQIFHPLLHSPDVLYFECRLQNSHQDGLDSVPALRVGVLKTVNNKCLFCINDALSGILLLPYKARIHYQAPSMHSSRPLMSSRW